MCLHSELPFTKRRIGRSRTNVSSKKYFQNDTTERLWGSVEMNIGGRVPGFRLLSFLIPVSSFRLHTVNSDETEDILLHTRLFTVVNDLLKITGISTVRGL